MVEREELYLNSCTVTSFFGTAMSVSIEDIATRARVSRMTVSNILSGRLNPTRAAAVRRAERIRKIAAELGYRPNAAARAINSGRFNAISLLLSTARGRSSLFGGMLAALQDTLEANDTQLVLSRVPDEKLIDEQRLPRFLRETCVDGVLINYTDRIPERMGQIIERHRMPAVWINSVHEHDCVYIDDQHAGYHLTRHLLELGHRRIAFSDYAHGPAFDSPHYSVVARKAGYARAMAEAGLPPRWIAPAEGVRLWYPQRVPHAMEVLAADDRPTAIVCYGQNDAVPHIYAAARLGLRVPQDLSVASFDEQPLELLGLRVTSMVLPEQAMGAAAGEMILHRVSEPGQSLPARVLQMTYEAGESTAPPGRS
jgi:LacI family transcriptional regulator